MPPGFDDAQNQRLPVDRTARRDEVTSRQLVGSSAAFGLSMAALALAPTLAFVFPAGILVGLSSIAFMTSSTAIVQVLAAPQYRGRVLAIQSMVFLGSTPIGAPIVGWVAESLGARAGFLVGGIASLAVGAAALWIGAQRRVDPAPAV